MSMQRKLFKPAAAALFLALGFLVGCLFQKGPANADKVAYRELERFSKVLQLIEGDYVEERKPADLIEGAIRGMVQSLDPHSAYMKNEVYREMKEETSGKFGGLGIEVSIKGGVITVISPIDDTPAFRAGIKTGDRIIRIGDKSTKNMNLPEAVTLMRGKPGSKIAIQILRPGKDAPLDFTLARESIKMQSVRGARLPGNLGYLRISSFQERTAEDLVKALDKISDKGPVDGVILDLRGNPGGLLDQAVRVANVFVDEGPIVYTIGRDRSKKEAEFAQKGRQKTTVPMVTLIDGASASASEIVAGALQDYGRSVIAGQRSFGKGSVQTVVPLDDAGLKLTIARYYTPSGRSIQAKGITPDVELEDIDPKSLEQARRQSQTLKEADLEGHFMNEEGEDDEITGEPPLEPAPNETKIELKTQKDKVDEASLPLEERLKRDYMVVQAQGVLKTMAVIRKGPRKPEFKLDEEPKKIDAKKKAASS